MRKHELLAYGVLGTLSMAAVVFGENGWWRIGGGVGLAASLYLILGLPRPNPNFVAIDNFGFPENPTEDDRS